MKKLLLSTWISKNLYRPSYAKVSNNTENQNHFFLLVSSSIGEFLGYLHKL